MKKILFFSLMTSSIIIYKAEGMFVDRNTFFKNVIGIDESKFQENAILIENSINWDAGQNSFFLKNASNNKLFRAGKFEAFSIGKLRNLTKDKKVSLTPGRFNVVEALLPTDFDPYYQYVDLGALQANPQNQDAVFQVESDSNALHARGRGDLMEDISRYAFDKDSLASISAAPGLILRYYYMFYNPTTPTSSWQQYAILDKLWEKNDAKKQLNLLENTDIPIENSVIAFHLKSPDQVINYNIENIKIGWHEGIQVTSGLARSTTYILIDDQNQIINQVFTTTSNFASLVYRNDKKAIAIAQALEDAAHEGTIRTAVAYNKKKVFIKLTYRKLPLMAAALEKMKDFIINSGIDVTLVIDGKDLRLEDQIDEFRTRMQKLVQDTGGQYIQYSKTNPMGKILVVQKAIEPIRQEYVDKNLIDALYNVTKKLQNIQKLLIPNKEEQLSYTIPEGYPVFPQYRHPLFLEKSLRYFMTEGFETGNKFYKAIIHDAFQQSPLHTSTKIVRLALQTKLSIEKQRALAIVKAYNRLQEIIDKNPENIVKDIMQDKELFNLFLNYGVKFK